MPLFNEACVSDNRAMMINTTQIAVLRASQAWVEHFNAGNADRCIAAYAPDCLMVAKPKGRFVGRDEIATFWRTFLASGAGQLRYSNIQINTETEGVAVLSADWEMNVGRGVVTREVWKAGADGTWSLTEDHFEIQESFEPSSSKGYKKTALIVVDLQEDYFRGGAMELEGTEAAAEAASRLLEHFRESRQPVIHIRHLFLSPDAPFFVPGTPGSQIHPSVAPRPDEVVVVKNHISSFLGTNLEDLLRKERIERVVIAGAMSHMCVEGTARAAHDLGFDTLVAEDACATLSLDYGGVQVPANNVHQTAMAALAFAYATVSSTDEICQLVSAVKNNA